MLGVIKVVPVPMLAPPLAAEYQFKVPADPVALNVTVPALHRLLGVVAVIVGLALTVATTAVLAELVQPVAVAST